MTRVEICAAIVAALTAAGAGWAAHARGHPRPAPGRPARFVLWLAIAAPLLFLLTNEGDRLRVYVRGGGGMFEALRLLAFSAAAAAAVTSLRPIAGRWWTTVLLVLGASAMGLGAAAWIVS